MKLQESGLLFEFDQDWVVKRYDTHTYYKGLSGVGLKAVDFIGIWKEEFLLLMEVKNYRNHHGYLSNEDLQPLLQQPELLVETFQQKVEDTVRAIETIRAYYQRQFWYRMILPIIHRFPVSKADRIFWTKAEQILHQGEKVSAVLWLELDAPYQYLYQQIQEQLTKKFPDQSFQTRLAHRSAPTFGDSLLVRSSKT